MSATLTTLLPPAPPTPADITALLRPLRRILSATVASADLLALELQVCDQPELSLLVRDRAPASVQALALWPTFLVGTAGHDGVLLVATAVAADAPRRVAAHSASLLIADLLTAERRRQQAERLASRAVELAGVDALTGLGNRRTWRRALDDEIARAARYPRSSTVVVIDLDGLKRINDSQGHAAGDAHLQQAAAAVRDASRNVDVVCRLGGDEFGILAPETSAEGAEHLTARLRSRLLAAGVGASIGAATATEGDLDAAWHLADTEMYLHKRTRGSA